MVFEGLQHFPPAHAVPLSGFAEADLTENVEANGGGEFLGFGVDSVAISPHQPIQRDAGVLNWSTAALGTDAEGARTRDLSEAKCRSRKERTGASETQLARDWRSLWQPRRGAGDREAKRAGTSRQAGTRARDS